MPTPIVDANYRFIAAYQEVNTRVTQRQQALASYVSIVVSLLAALVALRPSTAVPHTNPLSGRTGKADAMACDSG